MSNVVIGGTATGATALPTAVSIDGTNDRLAIWTASSNATQGISRSTLLGVTGQPADLTSTQTFQNKTIDNTNTFSIKDSLFTLVDNADTTKQAQFQLSGITTATTRTYTMPNASVTLASLTGTETLTNKTITSPTITSPTITNATITADSISGFSTANTGTIYGLPVTAGVLSTVSTVNGSALVASTVAAASLSTSAITLGYAAITTTATTTSATPGLIVGLTASVTIPAGGRKIKITCTGDYITISTAATVALSIWDGTVGSGTQLAETQVKLGGTGTNVPFIAMAIVTPAAGAKTYNVGISTTAGTATLAAAATAPAFILVEAI